MATFLPFFLRWPGWLLAAAVLSSTSAGALAQALPAVTVRSATAEESVEKSYRKMIRGMDLFERERALSPQGALRFRLLPRRRDTDMAGIAVEVAGSTVDFQVAVAPDNSFSLPRNSRAFEENAVVTPNRRKQSMTWRSDIRTPGLPPGTRRLGDLRLECRVGMEAGLISNTPTLAGRLLSALLDTPAYCDEARPLYLFFADKPLFSVTLIHGTRRMVLPADMLYAGATANPGLAADLPYCDCEVLVDRTYFLPLGDRSWPDDTLVAFDDMEAP
jgi:hypothetical protein